MNNDSTEHTSSVPSQVVATITIVILASCLGNLSQTALNAMFSGIALDFGIDVGLGQFVTTLYMLVLGITVPVLTYLMHRFSVKSIIVAALLFLLVGSCIDIVAQDFWVLIAGRVLQAISSGITLPMMMSLIMISFPRNKQATVMGIAGIAMGFAPNIGPTIGGWIASFAPWQTFFVLLALASFTLLVLAIICIKSQPAPRASTRFELLSFVLSTLGFGGLLVGFSNASGYEFTHPLVWAPLLIGVVSLALFVRRQRKVFNPLINMDIFESKQYCIGFWASNFLFASFMGITLILPLFVENVWGGTTLQAGISLLPSTIAALFMNPLAGILTDKIGIRPVVITTGLFLFVGSASMVFINETTPFALIMLLQGIRAIGVSGLISPLSSWSMAKLSPNLMTDGSAFSTAVRQACASMGTALMVLLVTSVSSLSLSLAVGYQLAFAFSAFCALLLFATVLLWVRR